MVPNVILLISKWQIDHGLFNATKLKQIMILNFHAPFADLMSPTAHQQLHLITVYLETLPGKSNWQ